jgi:hypothetical protein
MARARCTFRPRQLRTPPAIIYATSTPVRLRGEFFLHHNRKYFVLCRSGRLGGLASPRVSGTFTTACTRQFLL